MVAMETPHSLSAWKLMAPPTKVYYLLNLASIKPPPHNNNLTFYALFMPPLDGTTHKGPMRGHYPYEIERKKGSYFPKLGYVVVRK